MAWWNRLFKRTGHKSLDGAMYRVTSTLYSSDGKRAAEIREFDRGETCLLESDWIEDTVFKERHGGSLVGPFASPTHAERFIVATSWFNGE
ncbi:MAG: hypothetical protein P0Y64_13605 [Candidatus Sphingomonas colombiensis]|nr:hypothetical protein [Sphingomonas sp.]WEK42420.1 MAG: hypothetical protein P0Y64_13605 [Sphingomonas sp.]